MTIATWVLAVATTALAIEGGTALRGWFTHLGLSKRKRELDQMRREITLLHHAVWMDVTTVDQGSRADVDKRVQKMLQLDGWTPDRALLGQAGYFGLDRTMGRPG